MHSDVGTSVVMTSARAGGRFVSGGPQVVCALGASV